MEKLVYKYNGDTQIIRFNSAEKFNQYLIENISEIELVEDVEIIDLDASTAPVEVKEAPVEVKDAPKADMTVQDVINFLITCKSNGSNVEPIIEYVIDVLLSSVCLYGLALEHGLTVISDKEIAAADLREAGYMVSKEAPKSPEMTVQSIIEWVKKGGSDSDDEEPENLKNWILENCISDQDIQSEFKERDLDPDLDDDQIRCIADDAGVSVINSDDDAIEHLEDEGYVCLNTENICFLTNIKELILHY